MPTHTYYAYTLPIPMPMPRSGQYSNNLSVYSPDTLGITPDLRDMFISLNHNQVMPLSLYPNHLPPVPIHIPGLPHLCSVPILVKSMDSLSGTLLPVQLYSLHLTSIHLPNGFHFHTYSMKFVWYSFKNSWNSSKYKFQDFQNSLKRLSTI
jgi:hypothetical protein